MQSEFTMTIGQYQISTEFERLQPDVVWRFLTEHSTWARGIPYERFYRTIQSSLNFGAYDDRGRQVGFARVVTDYGQFAYICDVFVLQQHRGRGLGKALMEAIMSHPALAQLRRYALDTADAQGLYARYGFRNLSDPSVHMEILSRSTDLWPRS